MNKDISFPFFSLKNFLIITTILLFSFSIMPSHLVFGEVGAGGEQNIAELKDSIEDRLSEIAKLEKEIAAYNSKVAGTQAEAKTLQSAINALESQKKDLQNQISLTNLKIKSAEEEIANTASKIGESEMTIEENKKAIAKALVEIQRNGDSNIFILNFIKIGKGTFTEFLDESAKLLNFTQNIKQKINNLNGSIEDLNQNIEIYEKQKAELGDLSSDLSSKQGIVAQNQKEKDSLLKETKSEEAEYQKMIKDREAKVASLQSEISSFESQINYILNPSTLPGKNSLIWPLDKIVITQYFGNTEFAQSGAYNGSGHNGVDFGIAVGNNVYAAAGGVVMGAGDTDAACKNASYGKWILIKHDNGLATLYGHLSAIHVVEGQKVVVGEKIGLSGNTGYSTGPHLHFTVFASDAVKIFGPTEYKSKTCGTYMVMPYAATSGYLNPMDFLPK